MTLDPCLLRLSNCDRLSTRLRSFLHESRLSERREDSCRLTACYCVTACRILVKSRQVVRSRPDCARLDEVCALACCRDFVIGGRYLLGLGPSIVDPIRCAGLLLRWHLWRRLCGSLFLVVVVVVHCCLHEDCWHLVRPFLCFLDVSLGR